MGSPRTREGGVEADTWRSNNVLLAGPHGGYEVIESWLIKFLIDADPLCRHQWLLAAGSRTLQACKHRNKTKGH